MFCSSIVKKIHYSLISLTCEGHTVGVLSWSNQPSQISLMLWNSRGRRGAGGVNCLRSPYISGNRLVDGRLVCRSLDDIVSRIAIRPSIEAVLGEPISVERLAPTIHQSRVCRHDFY